MNDLVGRTIAAVHELEYGDVLLRFTDGTAVRIAGEGWEVDGVSIKAADADALLAEEAKRKREREEGTRRGRERAAEVEAKRAELGPAEFLAWMDANRPGWRVNAILKQTFLPALERELRAGHEMMTRVMSRQMYDNALADIPTKEPHEHHDV